MNRVTLRPMRLSFAQWLIVAALLGFGIGKIASPLLEAQARWLLEVSDSVSGTSTPVQGSGNAVNVIGK